MIMSASGPTETVRPAPGDGRNGANSKRSGDTGSMAQARRSRPCRAAPDAVKKGSAGTQEAITKVKLQRPGERLSLQTMPDECGNPFPTQACRKDPRRVHNRTPHPARSRETRRPADRALSAIRECRPFAPLSVFAYRMAAPADQPQAQHRPWVLGLTRCQHRQRRRTALLLDG